MTGMGAGRHRSACKVLFEQRKGALTREELVKARQLRAIRMSWDGVARAVGRSIPDLRAALDPTYLATE